MGEKKAVSILMAVYQAAEFLPACLNSIAVQTCRDFEVICIDDASTDASGDILRDFARRDSRFLLLTNEKRMGGGASRNLAARSAAGKYIFFMDPDDLLHPRMLECVLYFAERENADVVSFCFRRDAQFSPSEPLSAELESIPFQHVNQPFFKMGRGGKFRINFTYWTKLYRRDALNGIFFLEGTFENPHILSDFHHTAMALNRMRRCVALREPLYSYTCRPGSETRIPIDEQRIANYRFAINDLAVRLDTAHHAQIRRHLRNYLVSSVIRGQLRRLERLRLDHPDQARQVQSAFVAELREIRRLKLLGNPGFRFRHIAEWFRIYRMLML
ncbi:MAG: glycosyltransferase family 2 protein [Victivallaceae bacterium]|nr:glycosyltransferase family 2 protein [Victivallaceae bacterium]